MAQELTLERQAFEAHMLITNGLTHLALEDVSVTVNFADEAMCSACSCHTGRGRVGWNGKTREAATPTKNKLLCVAEIQHPYDDNGNATQLLLDGAVMFTYHDNVQDRLVKVEDLNGNTIAEYAYDPFGRRLWKEVGGTRTSFFYADEGLVAEYDAAGNESTSYGYRPDSTLDTDPLWMRYKDAYYFYQNDHPRHAPEIDGAERHGRLVRSVFGLWRSHRGHGIHHQQPPFSGAVL